MFGVGQQGPEVLAEEEQVEEVAEVVDDQRHNEQNHNGAAVGVVQPHQQSTDGCRRGGGLGIAKDYDAAEEETQLGQTKHEHQTEGQVQFLGY